jgi:hypothetical protein
VGTLNGQVATVTGAARGREEHTHRPWLRPEPRDRLRLMAPIDSVVASQNRTDPLFRTSCVNVCRGCWVGVRRVFRTCADGSRQRVGAR